MPEYAFEVRHRREQLGFAIALAPTAPHARRNVLAGLVEQEVGKRQDLKLFACPAPDLATCSEQIWITQRAFQARFQPASRQGAEDYLTDWEPSRLDEAASAGRLWTLVGDQIPTLVSGFHFVNRLEYLECAVPHRGPAMIVVL
jgi:hypothetical protein